jgi:hypothetical protein
VVPEFDVSLCARVRGPLPLRAWIGATVIVSDHDAVIQPGLLGRLAVSPRRFTAADVVEIVRPAILGHVGMLAILLRSGERLELQLGQADELLREFNSHGYRVG